MRGSREQEDASNRLLGRRQAGARIYKARTIEIEEQVCQDYAQWIPYVPEATKTALGKAWALGSAKGHRVGLRDYLVWAEEAGIPRAERFPASTTNLEDYAASRLGEKGSGGIRGKIYGIRAFHIRNRLPWQTSIYLKYVLEGVKRSAPKDGKRPKRRPVTRQRLEMLAEDLNMDDPKDVAVFAIATMAFFAQMRMGEILPTCARMDMFDGERHATGKDMGEPVSQAGSRVLWLPWTKVAKEEGEEVIICAQRGTIDPTRAWELHEGMNEIGSDTPLGSYLDLDGKRHILTVRKFIARCNEVWEGRDMPRLMGHCFRIGGTTYYLLAGVPPDVVKAMGRWSSDAFLKYWRSLELLGILHAENLDM